MDMEADMDLTKKTTILFPPRLYQHLVQVARRRGTSVGQLVRAACEAQYQDPTVDERLEAVRALAALSLPVGTPEQLAAESVPRPEDLLP